MPVRGRPATSTGRAGRVAGACASAVLAAACGTSPAPPSRPAAAPAPATTPTRLATAGDVPGAAVAPTPSRAARPVPARAGATAAARTERPGPSAAPANPPLPSGLPSSAPLRVRLGSECVTPGGEQRLLVETLPGAFVAYDNLYPDGRTGATHGGAQPHARADGTGRLTAVWRVAAGTPAGRVRVDVGVSARSGSAITMTYYRLAARC